MPLFICDECSAIENTALGFTNGEFYPNLWKDTSKNGKKLCSECAPAEYADGSPCRGGKWHGEFPKVIATEATVRERGLWPENARKGFQFLGKFEYLRAELSG